MPCVYSHLIDQRVKNRKQTINCIVAASAHKSFRIYVHRVSEYVFISLLLLLPCNETTTARESERERAFHFPCPFLDKFSKIWNYPGTFHCCCHYYRSNNSRSNTNNSNAVTSLNLNDRSVLQPKTNIRRSHLPKCASLCVCLQTKWTFACLQII